MRQDINERVTFGNFNSAAGIPFYLEEGLWSVVIEGSIECETAHPGVECVDKPEVWLRRLVYGIITPLLSHNESLHHVSLELGTHVASSTDPVIHASKHSGHGQMWVELQHFLHQITSHHPFLYCEEEQGLRCEESEDHPSHLEANATSDSVTSGGYVKVQSAPYAYDQGAKA